MGCSCNVNSSICKTYVNTLGTSLQPFQPTISLLCSHHTWQKCAFSQASTASNKLYASVHVRNGSTTHQPAGWRLVPRAMWRNLREARHGKQEIYCHLAMAASGSR